MARYAKIDDLFLGTGWAFPPSFDTGYEMVSAERDIDQSLRLILFTEPGERMMQQDFGCSLRRYTFSDMGQTSLTLMKDAIETAILKWEPRITLNSVDIDTSDHREGLLTISLDYTVRSTNARSNLVYPYYLTEANL
ncbi:MAG: GPW/gp25 family protein [Bacteroidota bacterium]